MNIPLGVDVHCVDGRCGRSTHIILNPATDTVTHIVVRKRRPSRVERLVPIERIENTTPELILLNCTIEDFLALENFQQTDFVYTDVPHYAADPKLTLLWPYVVPAKRVIDDSYRHVPPGELAVRRGARVRAIDGRIGKVDAFLVDTKDGQITHLVVRKERLREQEDVTIPISLIKRIEEGVVHLTADKAAVAALPTIRVKRSW